jgi:hypothetical protein
MSDELNILLSILQTNEWDRKHKIALKNPPCVTFGYEQNKDKYGHLWRQMGEHLHCVLCDTIVTNFFLDDTKWNKSELYRRLGVEEIG